MRGLIGVLAAFLLAGCAGQVARPDDAPAVAPVSVQIIAFNDFHGNLEAGKLAVEVPGDGTTTRLPGGGAAYFASAVAKLREGHPNSVTVSAGDMISASPLVSSMFLDEPTIHAMNMVGVDFNAVGNHEFDRGQKELLRLQKGGCEKNTRRQPCAVEPFTGARFGYLAANVAKDAGGTLFPSTGIRTFGKGARQVKVAFIGMTLKGTSTLVMASGIAGLHFEDEADTVNALVPKLKAEGADAIVVLIHQGGYSKRAFDANSCEGMTGDIFPILERLDPRVDLVVSGHTHNAYVCDYGTKDPTRPLLLTSAGYGGTLLTDITLDIDPAAGRVVAKRASNVLVQGEPFTSAKGPVAISDRYPRFAPEPRVAALVARYAAAAKSAAERPIGKLTAPAPRADDMQEQVLGNLVADAQLAATAAPAKGGAEIALMNAGSVRAALTPRADGTITFGDIYAAQPFGNVLVVKQLTGGQLRAVLEQQFDDAKAGGHNLLLVSRGFGFGYDLGRPVGQRVIDPKLNGAPIVDDRVYRVVVSNFLGNGGDGFTTLIGHDEVMTGVEDLEALEAYFARGPVTPPATDRTKDLTLR
ncbi:bifunctional metallophosphatase/5'-nucleotidase [Sphingomonas psychrotolerans]|uniref:Bifunctional metallophosphatase/5'-nucleotidase n=1 Tax=Sphingomonas psychrotolerans TaxID=1327635 RepID=A0ABU3N5H0_9SPHN|nr:bifunctional metallophosphatase/5'-nucleotidase [Sphingomonas psychrotolerans]MDT8759017.1 bifunctional metallophosphatase/5'-nucleotidase [Sphingomonas psychrotolerans]